VNRGQASPLGALEEPREPDRRQATKPAWIQRVNEPLYRAYLLKEHLRLIFQLPYEAALELLEHWLDWAFRCRLQPFIALADRIVDHLDALIATLQHELSKRPRGGEPTPGFA
jgi:transposase